MVPFSISSGNLKADVFISSNIAYNELKMINNDKGIYISGG